jgi:DNA-binding protein H-NS
LFGPLLFRQSISAEVNETFVFNRFYALNAAGDGYLKDTKLYMTMPLDDLWKLHDQVISALASRIESQKLELEKRLEQLGTRFGGSPRDLPKARPYPKVSPKFRNPESPAETWSGRGKQPHWVLLLLAKGGSLEDCRIQ